MRSLSARDVLEAWEEGRRAAAAERVSPALARALPKVTPEDLERLPLGRRDALLLALHRATFGSRLDLLARCPSCGASLELEIGIDELLPGEPAPPSAGLAAEVYETTLGEHDDAASVRFRLATGLDLHAAAQATDPKAARRVLVERVVQKVRRGAVSVALDSLDDQEIRRLAAAMSDADPLAEILLHLSCSACGRAFDARFEIADCLWRRLDESARSLLRDVHVLARSYGWPEADILALDAGRRRDYLSLIADREAWS